MPINALVNLGEALKILDFDKLHICWNRNKKIFPCLFAKPFLEKMGLKIN